MKIAWLVLLAGCINWTGEGERPEVSNLTCTPATLTIGQRPHQVACSVDFDSPDHGVHEISWTARDASGRVWSMGFKQVMQPGVKRGTISFTILATTDPAPGTVTITMEAAEIDQGQSSEEIATTIAAVAP
jgi:hypothetical protein